MLNDELDELNGVRLLIDRLLVVGHGHERGRQAYGDVVRVHHVLVLELAQVVEEGEQVAQDDVDGPRHLLHHASYALHLHRLDVLDRRERKVRLLMLMLMVRRRGRGRR